MVQVFLLKPAPSCKLSTGLGRTKKSSIFSLRLSLSLPLGPLLRHSFYLKLSERSARNCLFFPPLLSGNNGSPDTHFSWGTNAADELAGQVARGFLVSIEELVLSCIRCNGHSLPLRALISLEMVVESRILHAAPAYTRPRTRLVSFCTSSYGLIAPLALGESLPLCELWSRPWKIARLLGLHGFPPCPYPSEGVG